MLNILKQISHYQSPERIKKNAEKEYGLSPEEAIEMAYENVIETAKHSIKGISKLLGNSPAVSGDNGK